jgi:hypothetical protein
LIHADTNNDCKKSIAEKMYQIEKTFFGFHITLAGLINDAEARAFVAELQRLRSSGYMPQAAIIDIRELIPPEPSVVEIFSITFRMAKETDLQRMAVIVKSPVVKVQTIQSIFMWKTDNFTRIFDASKLDNWQKLSFDWAAHCIEPADDITYDTGHINLRKLAVPE